MYLHISRASHEVKSASREIRQSGSVIKNMLLIGNNSIQLAQRA